jgi:hypothetical protein
MSSETQTLQEVLEILEDTKKRVALTKQYIAKTEEKLAVATTDVERAKRVRQLSLLRADLERREERIRKIYAGLEKNADKIREHMTGSSFADVIVKSITQTVVRSFRSM